MWFKVQRPDRNTGPSPSELRLWFLTVLKKIYSSLPLQTLHHFNLTVALRLAYVFFFSVFLMPWDVGLGPGETAAPRAS